MKLSEREVVLPVLRQLTTTLGWTIILLDLLTQLTAPKYDQDH